MEKEVIRVEKGTLMEKFLELYQNHANSWVFLHQNGAKKEIIDTNICISFYYGCGHEWKHICSAYKSDKPHLVVNFGTEEPEKIFFLKLAE